MRRRWACERATWYAKTVVEYSSENQLLFVLAARFLRESRPDIVGKGVFDGSDHMAKLLEHPLGTASCRPRNSFHPNGDKGQSSGSKGFALERGLLFSIDRLWSRSDFSDSFVTRMTTLSWPGIWRRPRPETSQARLATAVRYRGIGLSRIDSCGYFQRHTVYIVVTPLRRNSKRGKKKKWIETGRGSRSWSVQCKLCILPGCCCEGVPCVYEVLDNQRQHVSILDLSLRCRRLGR